MPTFQALVETANRLYQSGQHQEAEKAYQQALEEANLPNPEDPRLATVFNNLGLVYYAQNQYDLAQPAYQKALQIRQKALGNEHPHVAMTLYNLALLYFSQGRLEDSENLCKQALAIRKQLDSVSPLDIALCQNTLSLIYLAQGLPEKAKPFCEAALKIREQALGQTHPLVTSTQNSLVQIYQALGVTETTLPIPQNVAQPQSIPLYEIEKMQPPMFRQVSCKTQLKRKKRRLGFGISPLESRLSKRSWGWQNRQI